MLKKEYGGFNTFSSNWESREVSIFNKYEYSLNLARHALQILIKCRSITHILAPFYTCHSIHKTLKDANIEISYYHIDRDFTPLLTDADVENSQALLINNYFGISGEVIDNLVQKYGSKIIVDNSQSYYSRHSEEIDHFNSPRKFFGVTDGGVLTTTRDISDLYSYLEFDKSADRIFNLFASDESSMNDCYDNYLNYRNNLQSLSMMRMSKSTENILKLVDFDFCKQARRRNFEKMHKNLARYNKLNISMRDSDVPMLYPFLYLNLSLKKKLIENNIYIGSYWPLSNYADSSTEIEDGLRENLCCLPIDQTLTDRDIEFICSIVINFIDN